MRIGNPSISSCQCLAVVPGIRGGDGSTPPSIHLTTSSSGRPLPRFRAALTGPGRVLWSCCSRICVSKLINSAAESSKESINNRGPLACKNHCSSRRSSARLSLSRLHPPLLPGSSQPCGSSSSSAGSTRASTVRRGRQSCEVVCPFTQPTPNHLCFLVTNAGFNAPAPC